MLPGSHLAPLLAAAVLPVSHISSRRGGPVTTVHPCAAISLVTTRPVGPYIASDLRFIGPRARWRLGSNHRHLSSPVDRAGGHVHLISAAGDSGLLADVS